MQHRRPWGGGTSAPPGGRLRVHGSRRSSMGYAFPAVSARAFFVTEAVFLTAGCRDNHVGAPNVFEDRGCHVCLYSFKREKLFDTVSRD